MLTDDQLFEIRRSIEKDLAIYFRNKVWEIDLVYDEMLNAYTLVITSVYKNKSKQKQGWLKAIEDYVTNIYDIEYLESGTDYEDYAAISFILKTDEDVLKLATLFRMKR